MPKPKPKKVPAKKAPKTKLYVGPKTLQRDTLRIGADAAQMKATTDPKVWKNIVKDAHKAGNTLSSYISNTPDPLKAKTQTYLKQQAGDLIKQTYEPLKSSVSEQQKQLDNMRSKQMSDANYYKQWLDTKNAASQANAQAQDASYAASIADAQAKANAAQQNIQTQTAGNAASLSSGSDPTQSRALAGVTDTINKNTQAAQDARNLTETYRVGNAAQSSAQGAHAVGSFLSDTAKLRSNLDKQQGDLTSNSRTMEAQQKADLQKALLNLQGAEATKAEQAGSLAAVNEKLKVGAASDAAQRRLDAQKLNASITKDNRAAALADRALNLKGKQFEWGKSNDLLKYGLDVKRFNLDSKIQPYKIKEIKAKLKEAGQKWSPEAEAEAYLGSTMAPKKGGFKGKRPLRPSDIKSSPETANHYVNLLVSKSKGRISRQDAKKAVAKYANGQ